MRRLSFALLLALCGWLALGIFVRVPAQAANQPAGGVVLDGYGGIHPFGGVQVNTAGAPYWPGWDIARSLVVLPDGSGGWVLDGYGGIHNFGSAAPITTPAYWPGWDIARSLAVYGNGQGGYLLDGYGGIHRFGSAPQLSGGPYWAGWDIARGLDIHLDNNGAPDGAWVLDGWGGIHSAGNAPALNSPRLFVGFDVFRQLHVVGGGAYEVAQWGIVDRVGSPAGIDWTGRPDWGAWSIVRDVVPINPSGSWKDQPISRAAAGALMDAVQNYDRAARGIYGLGENGVLDAIAGNGFSYNLAGCGGGNATISDRTQDMYNRNLFTHQIVGCSGTQYVFSTYLSSSSLHWGWAGENIAWLGGTSSLLDSAWQTNNNWLNSPEHYANITGGNYHSIGCGTTYAAGGSYQGWNGPTYIWVCEFTG